MAEPPAKNTTTRVGFPLISKSGRTHYIYVATPRAHEGSLWSGPLRVIYFRPHPITAADIDQIVSRYPREAGVGPSVRGDPKRGATVMERWLR